MSSHGNKGIINTGTIGGDASNIVVEGDANALTVKSSDAVSKVQQHAERTGRELRELEGAVSPEFAAVTAVLVHLANQAARVAEKRTEDSQRLLTAIDDMRKELATSKPAESTLRRVFSRVVEISSKVADVAPDAIKFATQIGRLLGLPG